jgi:PD-(D/E)XK nuclease superfamily
LLCKCASALRRNNIDWFCSTLSIAFADIPHQLHISQEEYYYSLFQQLCALLDNVAASHVSRDKGRIEIVLETTTHLFIFELKLNESAEVALLQMEERTYGEKYRLSHKHIVLTGLSIQRSNQHLTLDYLTKELPSIST